MVSCYGRFIGTFDCMDSSIHCAPDPCYGLLNDLSGMLHEFSHFLFFVLFFFGSFMPIHTGAETDLRFIYCAGKRKTKDNLISLLSCVNKTYSKDILVYQLPSVLCWKVGAAWIGRRRRSTYRIVRFVS